MKILLCKTGIGNKSYQVQGSKSLYKAPLSVLNILYTAVRILHFFSSVLEESKSIFLCILTSCAISGQIFPFVIKVVQNMQMSVLDFFGGKIRMTIHSFNDT